MTYPHTTQAQRTDLLELAQRYDSEPWYIFKLNLRIRDYTLLRCAAGACKEFQTRRVMGGAPIESVISRMRRTNFFLIFFFF